MTCSKKITRTGLRTTRNRCGCECVTVETSEDLHCLTFFHPTHGTFVLNYRTEYLSTGDMYAGANVAPTGSGSGSSAYPTPGSIQVSITCNGNSLVMLVDGVAYSSASPGCCIPVSSAITFNADYPVGDPEVDTLVVSPCVDIDICSSPLVCDDCADPVPCAYKIINLCPQLKDVDMTCDLTPNADPYDVNLKAWLLEEITLRQRCSNGSPCTYYALAPLNTWVGTSYFGVSGIAYSQIGPDITSIMPGFQDTLCIPCSWFDAPLFGLAIGMPLWVDCNGGGGGAGEHRLADDNFYELSGGEAYSPLCALALDTVLGKLVPNYDFFAAETGGNLTQPGNVATWGFPRFPAYSLVPGATWNCTGCNRMVKDSPEDDDPWNMPKYIEIVPIWRDDNIMCEGSDDIITDPNCGYESKAERKSCCDPCCRCGTGVAHLVCGTTSYECTGEFCQSNTPPHDGTPSPTREMCCDFTIDGTTYNVCFIMYCNDGLWFVDVYCDDTYESTVSSTRTSCCPLALKFNYELVCAGCVGCAAYEEDCVVPLPCCGDVDLPDTVTAEIGSDSYVLTKVSTGSPSHPYGYDSGGDVDICGDGSQLAHVGISCFEDTWRLTFGLSCSDPGGNTSILEGTCEPFEFSGGPLSICSGDTFFCTTGAVYISA